MNRVGLSDARLRLLRRATGAALDVLAIVVLLQAGVDAVAWVT